MTVERTRCEGSGQVVLPAVPNGTQAYCPRCGRMVGLRRVSGALAVHFRW